ncbi:MAG: hypothetical protein AB1609_11580 [Bacillota bacterium]
MGGQVRPATSGLDEIIQRIERVLSPFKAAEQRAAELLATAPRARLFVGVCGVTLEAASFAVVDEFITLRSVSNPPSAIHIAQVADLTDADYLAVSRYSSSVTSEIAVGHLDIEKAHQLDLLLHLAWHTAAMLKLRGHDGLICPVASTVSWDVVPAIKDRSVRFYLLDDSPRLIVPTAVRSRISNVDMEWTKTHWDSALDLRNVSVSRRFGLAFSIAYYWNHTFDLRIALSNLWCGLEALFGERHDRPVVVNLA